MRRRAGIGILTRPRPPEEPTRVTDPKPDWPVAFFDDDYLRIYRPQFTPERTEAETRFIAGGLALPERGDVLDLACGFGRHAIGMAKLGHRVTGLDFNPRYLEIAAADAAAAGVEVRWRAGDMRAIGDERAFDGVYSFFTSFGYFDDDDNERVRADDRPSPTSHSAWEQHKPLLRPVASGHHAIQIDSRAEDPASRVLAIPVEVVTARLEDLVHHGSHATSERVVHLDGDMHSLGNFASELRASCERVRTILK